MDFDKDHNTVKKEISALPHTYTEFGTLKPVPCSLRAGSLKSQELPVGDTAKLANGNDALVRGHAKSVQLFTMHATPF